MSIHRGGLKYLRRFAALLAASLAGIGVCAGASAAGDGFTDMNAIIRSLGPVEYLPEHGGKRPSIDLEVQFAFDSAVLLPGAADQLDELAAALKSRLLQGSRARITGHTDASGTRRHNQSLSERRAASVKNYLVTKHGIAPSRLAAAGRGEDKLKYPLAPYDLGNRRVEIISLAPIRQSGAGLGAKRSQQAADQRKGLEIEW